MNQRRAGRRLTESAKIWPECQETGPWFNSSSLKVQLP